MRAESYVRQHFDLLPLAFKASIYRDEWLNYRINLSSIAYEAICRRVNAARMI
jgi:hypothetical protein